MFDLFTKPFETVLDVLDGLIDGELPTKRQVAHLLSTGVTIAAIAEATGFAEDVIKGLVED